MEQVPDLMFYARQPGVLHVGQGKKACAGYKPALNTSAVHRCIISLQNIAQPWQGAGGKASAGSS